jgi:hypothetical protein
MWWQQDLLELREFDFELTHCKGSSTCWNSAGLV